MTRLVDANEGSFQRDYAGKGGLMAEWLQETDGNTIFEGDVLLKGEPRTGPNGEKAWGIEYDVTRGGSDLDPGPDPWLTEHLLARFEGRRVRITIEDLGPSSPLPNTTPRETAK